MSIHAELNDLMTRKGYSQTQVARAVGKSAAVINQYLQGKYAGDVPSIDELARSFIPAEYTVEKEEEPYFFLETDRDEYMKKIGNSR